MLEDKLNEDKKEELRNIFCYLYYNDELTNVVPATLTPYEFNSKMQQFYKDYKEVQKQKPNLYENALKKWEAKKLYHENNRVNTVGFKESTNREVSKMKED